MKTAYKKSAGRHFLKFVQNTKAHFNAALLIENTTDKNNRKKLIHLKYKSKNRAFKQALIYYQITGKLPVLIF